MSIASLSRTWRSRPIVVGAIVLGLALLGGCAAPSGSAPAAATAAQSSGASAAPTGTSRPAWFNMRMTDVLTGQTFTINDFAGRVVLVETMAEWCPTCIQQQAEVARLHERLAGSDDVISISLDIDVHEDEPSLREYASTLGHTWRYAVAPLEVARALGNLYSAEYLNPPYSPMLLIDRDGVATSLPYGVKTADYLLTALEPHLAH